MPSAAALTIEDRISDPMMPELDPSLLDFRPMDVDFGSKKDDALNWSSQVLSDPMSIEIGRHAPARDQAAEFDEEDMNIDLDLDLGLDDGPSIELGRKAPPIRTLEDDTIGDLDKYPEGLGLEDQTRLSSRVPSLMADDDGREPENEPILLDEDDGLQFPIDAAAAAAAPHTHSDLRLRRDSQSPLSSVRSSMAREFEATNLNEEEEGATVRQATHKAKKRKVLQADADTMLSSNQIKQQQADRSAILKPTSFLPRDPTLLALMNMQKNGGFVSSVMGDGRVEGLAPELRGILSIEMVRKSGELKRKRDSAVADVSETEAGGGTREAPFLQIPDDETFGAIDDGGAERDVTAACNVSEIHLPAEDGLLPADEDVDPAEREDEDLDPARDQFDETTAPLLHPSQQGAISQGTKHAVHLLRDRFGSSAGGSPSQHKKAQILFQDLLPERTTSKADATKMFFEVLVLATKDAVKVEQADKAIGTAIRVRAKLGLWGVWAENEAGGEIAKQDDIELAAATAS